MFCHSMFLWLLDHLSAFSTEAIAACEKISPRAAMAAGLSFLAAVLLGPRWIAWLKPRFREPIKSDSAEIARLHGGKQSTPTMGGLFVVAAILAAAMVFGDLNNVYLPPALFTIVGLTAIGAVDDLVKIRSPRNGLSARWKLVAQTVVAAAAAVWFYRCQSAVPDGLTLHVPLVAEPIQLGMWFIPLAVLVIVGSSNAVNLADGLDGLAGGCLLAAAAAMTGLVYAAGHAEWAAYLGVPRIPQAGEMTVLAGAMIGGVLGFLWFNCHPAQVFLGNTGALPLGGLLGVLALVARQELLLLVIAGVFVVEAVSVILQVGYYKLRRRRLFRCAPLHHHFQLLGWAENKIVVRFWIAAALCALAGAASLKLNAGDAPPNVAEKIEWRESNEFSDGFVLLESAGDYPEIIADFGMQSALTPGPSPACGRGE
ncbi:MAG: phospho-N-acetylmuramoyl-pentapeptide-transferase [Pirellulales bacterium]|nr:phospho-N-acetylmuramoyl-pentapeptide-transferase [Pirellulales bacterium]